MIDVRGVERSYVSGGAATQALRGVDLQLTAGTVTAVFGRSGSGKTTLLNCIGALDRPDAGTVTVGDIEVSSLSPARAARWRRRHLGFVYQAHALLPWLDAVQNVEVALRLAGAARRDRRRTAIEALDAVGLGDRTHHLPTELSGGQQQRVAVARAIAARPDVLLADEPTASLDGNTAEVILGVLRDVARAGSTVVIATHDHATRSIADVTVEITDGVVAPPS